MNTISVECFSNAPNAVVIRACGRKYPGMLIQGDSLNNLYALANEILENLDAKDANEARDVTELLIDTLQGYKNHYESVLTSAGIELPYPKPK